MNFFIAVIITLFSFNTANAFGLLPKDDIPANFPFAFNGFVYAGFDDSINIYGLGIVNTLITRDNTGTVLWEPDQQ